MLVGPKELVRLPLCRHREANNLLQAVTLCQRIPELRRARVSASGAGTCVSYRPQVLGSIEKRQKYRTSNDYLLA